MNPYFWCFAVYALWITPVTVDLQIRYEEQFHWRLLIRLAGIEVLSKKKQDSSGKAKSSRGVLQGAGIKDVLRVFRWESVQVYARLSFQDAALTSLTYAFLRTVLDTLSRTKALPSAVHGRIEADFRGLPSIVETHCILSARLGSLAIACARLAWARRRAQKRQMREEPYAASH